MEHGKIEVSRKDPVSSRRKSRAKSCAPWIRGTRATSSGRRVGAGRLSERRAGPRSRFGLFAGAAALIRARTHGMRSDRAFTGHN